MAQAQGRCLELITLPALVEESSQAGARRALASLGLDDERARSDVEFKLDCPAWIASIAISFDV